MLHPDEPDAAFVRPASRGAKSKNNMVDFLAGSPRMRESPRMPSLPDVRDPSLKQSSSPRHSKALKTARRMQAPSPEPSIDEEEDCDLEHTIEIVRGMLSRKMCECAAWFEAADLDGNGVIDRDEFRLTVKGLRWGVSNAVCDALFNEMDTDRSGGITHDEYTKYVLRDTLRRQAPTAMQALWLMDEDRSGTIEKWEFRRAVGKMGVIVPNIYLIDELFDEIDTDRSGSLSMDEINFFFRHGRTRKAAMARRYDNVRSKVDRGDSPRRGRSLPMQRPPPMTSLPGLPKLPMPTRRDAHHEAHHEVHDEAQRDPLRPKTRPAPSSMVISPRDKSPRRGGGASPTHGHGSPRTLHASSHHHPTDISDGHLPSRSPPAQRRSLLPTVPDASPHDRVRDAQSLPMLRPPRVPRY